MRCTREQRRQLARDNLQFPIALQRLPDAEWKRNTIAKQIEVWRSREFLVQVFAEGDGVIRLTVCKTAVAGDDWQAEIAWEELQRLKRECGRGEQFAVEVYPADVDVVNVANMRHLWILPIALPFAWRRVQ